MKCKWCFFKYLGGCQGVAMRLLGGYILAQVYKTFWSINGSFNVH